MTSVSEEELEKYKQQMQAFQTQFSALGAVWEPMKQMIQELMGKIGVTVEVNKARYLRNRGELVYGIVFKGPTHILDQMAVQMSGKALHVEKAREIEIGEGNE
jgi:hypothetical protein